MAVSKPTRQIKGGDKDYNLVQRGMTENIGVVEGIVKANTHPTNMGVISVFIPRHGEDQKDPNQWRQVRYSSPFYSRTDASGISTDNFLETKTPAGFITPPPDIGTKVLCVFPDGINRLGYYFACVPDTYMLQTLPESSASKKDKSYVVAGEFNDRSPGQNVNKDITNFRAVKRPLDTFKQTQLTLQGLNFDPIRGLSTSSYMRESPSELVGITSKGRKVDKQGFDVTKQLSKGGVLTSGNASVGIDDIIGNVASLDAGGVDDTTSELSPFGPGTKITPTTEGASLEQIATAGALAKKVIFTSEGKAFVPLSNTEQDRLKKDVTSTKRKKGHSITLDDGDVDGNSQQIRLLSSTGHQILLNDNEGVIYIGHKTGKSWIELGKDGQIDIYGQDSINFRTKDFNFHADGNIKFHSKGYTQFVSEEQTHIESKGQFIILSQDEFGITSSEVSIASSGSVNIAGSGASSFKTSGPLSLSGALVLLQGPGSAPKSGTPVQRRAVLQPKFSTNRGDWLAKERLITSVDRVVTHEPFVEHNTPTKSSAFTGGLKGGGMSAIGMVLSVAGAAMKLQQSGMFANDAAASLSGPNSLFSNDAASSLSNNVSEFSIFANDANASISDTFGSLDAFGGLGDTVGNLTDLSGLDKIQVTGGDFFTGFFEGGEFASFTDSIANSELVEGASSLFKSVGDSIGSIPGAIEDVVGSIPSEIKDIPGQILSDVNKFKQGFSQATAELDKVLPGGSALLNTATDGAFSQVGNVVDVLAQPLELAGGVLKFVEGAPDKLDGILNGSPNLEKIELTDIAKIADVGVELGVLDQTQYRALNAGIVVAAESKHQADFVNPNTKAVGKYGHTAKQLERLGFVRQDAFFNDQLSDPGVWTGKNGMNNLTTYLANENVQDLVNQNLISENYQAMLNNGAIRTKDSSENTMSMLTVAAMTSPDVARRLRAGDFDDYTLIKNTSGLVPGDYVTQLEKFAKIGSSASTTIDNQNRYIRNVEQTIPAGATKFTGSYDPKTSSLENYNGETYVVPKNKTTISTSTVKVASETSGNTIPGGSYGS